MANKSYHPCKLPQSQFHPNHQHSYLSKLFTHLLVLPTVIHPHSYSPPQLFTPTVIHPHSYSPPLLFTPTVIHPHCYSPPQLFTPTVIHPHCYSPPLLFSHLPKMTLSFSASHPVFCGINLPCINPLHYN